MAPPLIIDDDQIFGSQIAEQLAGRDWPVSLETDSRVIAFNRLTQYQAVLVDLNMPYRTGLQLINEFRDQFTGLMAATAQKRKRLKAALTFS